MRLQQFLLGLIVFIVVFLGIYSSLGYITSKKGYNVDTSDDIVYREKYNLISDFGINFEEQYTTLQNVTVDKGAGFFTGLASVFSLGKTIVSAPFNIINVIWNGLMVDLNLPKWIDGVAMVIITIFLIFALMAIILRWKA